MNLVIVGAQSLLRFCQLFFFTKPESLSVTILRRCYELTKSGLWWDASGTDQRWFSAIHGQGCTQRYIQWQGIPFQGSKHRLNLAWILSGKHDEPIPLTESLGQIGCTSCLRAHFNNPLQHDCPAHSHPPVAWNRFLGKHLFGHEDGHQPQSFQTHELKSQPPFVPL